MAARAGACVVVVGFTARDEGEPGAEKVTHELCRAVELLPAPTRGALVAVRTGSVLVATKASTNRPRTGPSR